jgi:hypothetical protein
MSRFDDTMRTAGHERRRRTIAEGDLTIAAVLIVPAGDALVVRLARIPTLAVTPGPWGRQLDPATVASLVGSRRLAVWPLVGGEVLIVAPAAEPSIAWHACGLGPFCGSALVAQYSWHVDAWESTRLDLEQVASMLAIIDDAKGELYGYG